MLKPFAKDFINYKHVLSLYSDFCRTTMDPRSSAQDVQQWNLCESELVHSHCNFCHINFCKLGIGDHISDGYDKHKMVLFQERRSTLI